MKKKRIFEIGVHTRGQLISSFVFENNRFLNVWKETSFKDLEKMYGRLELNVFSLPGLQIGDTCKVQGEGDEEFKILGLMQYSTNRYGFILDNGLTEEVVKCY